MPDPSFESLLAGRLREYAEAGVRPIDRYVIAEGAIEHGRSSVGWRPLLVLGRSRLAVLVVLGLLAIALIGTVIAGAWPPAPIDRLPAQIDLPPAQIDRVAGGPGLVYGSKAGGLFVADADGSNAVRIAADGLYFDPRWSADGRYIAAQVIPRNPIAESSSLVVLRPDGSRVARLTSQTGNFRFAWGRSEGSRDWLAATIDDAVVIFDVSASTTSTIVDIPDGECVGGIAWSPTNPTLIWTDGCGPRRAARAEIHLVDIADRDAGPTAVDGRSLSVELPSDPPSRGPEDVTVSPDGLTLAFRARIDGWLASRLIVVPIEGGASRTLPSRVDADSGFRFTSDARAVVAEGLDDVPGGPVVPVIMPIDGTPRRSLASGGATDGSPWVVPTSVATSPGDDRVLLGSDASGLVLPEYLDLPQRRMRVFDLWVVLEDGSSAHKVADDAVGGDLR